MLDCICKIINYNFLGMSFGGWFFSFIISCLASYLILKITILKDREEFRKKRIEKLIMMKSRMYRVRDWADSIKRNIDAGRTNVLDTNENILPKESLIIALQLEELKDEYNKIIVILDLIAMIELNCKYKRYLIDTFEKQQLLDMVSNLWELSNELATKYVDIKKRDLTDELAKVKFKVKK